MMHARSSAASVRGPHREALAKTGYSGHSAEGPPQAGKAAPERERLPEASDGDGDGECREPERTHPVGWGEVRSGSGDGRKAMSMFCVPQSGNLRTTELIER